MMTKTRLTAFALCALMLFGFSGISAAAEKSAMSLAIVDMNKVMHKAVAAEGIRNEISSKYKQFQVEIDKEEKSLRAETEAFSKKKDSLSKDEHDKQEKVLRARYDKTERLMDDRKMTLTQANNVSMRKLMKEVTNILEDLAQKKGYDVILTQESVILASKAMDITDEVLVRLNKDVKKIPIDWSAKPKAPKKK